MAKFGIYSAAGVKKAEGYPTFTGTYMKAGVLDFREIASPTPIEWAVGDYVDYTRTGRRYKLYTVPQVRKQARNGYYGGAFVYQNVQFFDDSHQADICPFRDLVPGDNRVHFSTQPQISVFDNVAGIAERLQACLEDMYGSGSWVVRTATAQDGASRELLDLMDDDREFVVSGVSIKGALDKVYELWPEVGFVYTIEGGVNTLVIGGAGLNANEDTYKYGKGYGLTSIAKTVANADDMANRIYVYGSSKNMLSRWYSQFDIKDADSVDIQHLMLPISVWGTTDNKPDPAKAFIETAGASANLRPKTVYFDGSKDLKEVYPTIRETTIQALWDAMPQGSDFRPKTNVWSGNERVDKILSAQASFDSGLAADNGKSAVQNLSWDAVVSSSSSHIVRPNFSVPLFARDFALSEAGSLNFEIVLNVNGTVSFPGTEKVMLRARIHRGYSDSTPTFIDQSVELEKNEAGNFVLAPASFSASRVQFASTGGVLIEFSLEFSVSSSEASDTLAIAMDGSLTAAVSRYRSKTFNVTLRQIGFDISAQANLGDGKTMVMRSGKCVGRAFKISSTSYNSTTDTWDVELIRSNDESLSQWFPNNDYPVEADDEFVLTEIAMPDIYISLAENRLLAAAQELLADTSKEQWQYTPEIDAKFMVESGRTIIPAVNVTLEDEIVPGGSVSMLVDSVTINEGEAAIPTYKVTLRDKKRKSYSDTGSVQEPSSVPVSTVQQTATPGHRTVINDTFFEEDGQGGIQLKEEYAGLRTKGYLIGASDGGPGGGGGGGLIERLWRVGDLSDDVTDFDNAANDTFNAYTINSLHTRILALEQNPGGVTSLSALTDVALGTLADKDVLSYDSVTSKWKNVALGDAAYLGVASAIGSSVTGLVPGSLLYDVLGDSFDSSNSVKDFVNSSIATATATYQGSCNVTSLPATPSGYLPYNATHAQIETALGTYYGSNNPDNNDYCFVEIPVSGDVGAPIGRTERYKFDGTNWGYEYTLNNSGFTAAQWAAINSQITGSKVTSYDTVIGYFTNGVLDSSHIPTLSTSKISGLDTALLNINNSITALEKMFIDDEYATGKHRLKVNSTYFDGIITEGFLVGAADGGPTSGGGGGIDLNLMWASLQNTTPDTHATDKFHKNHLPAIVASDGISAGYTLDSGNLATHLNIGISSIDMTKVSGLSQALGNKADASALAGYLPLSAGSSYPLTNRLYLKNGDTQGVTIIPGVDPAISLYGINRWLHINAVGGLLSIYSGAYDPDGTGNHGAGINITTSNNVGVGTQYPGYKFDVSGSLNATTIFQNGVALGSRAFDSTSYLPLSGGTLTGDLKIGSSTTTDSLYFRMYKKESNVEYESRFSTGAAATWFYYSPTNGLYTYLRQSFGGGLVYCDLNGAEKTVYHSGNLSPLTTTNYGSYALPLTGGTLSGSLTIGGSGNESALSLSMYRTISNNNYRGQLYTGSDGIVFSHYNSTSGIIASLRMSYAGIIFSDNFGNGDRTVWHSGNSNRATVQWSASSLALAGSISGATSIDSLLYFDATNGRVGIGTPSPDQKLHVVGQAKVSNTTSNSIRLIPNADAGIEVVTSGQWIHFAGSGSSMFFYNGAWDSAGAANYYKGITISTTNFIGIGTASPSYKLDVSGVIHSTTGVLSPGYGNFAASYSSSDQRLKDDIETIKPEYAIEKLMALRPSEWVWNEKSSLSGRKGAGLVAQHVEPVLPWNLEKSGEYLSLNYDMFHPYEIGSIQFLKGETDMLKNEVAELRNRVETLESENKRLKERIYA